MSETDLETAIKELADRIDTLLAVIVATKDAVMTPEYPVSHHCVDDQEITYDLR